MIETTYVVQYLNNSLVWSDMTDGTSSYYHGDKGKPFKSVEEARKWCLEYHDPKTYPAKFEPDRWRIVKRTEETHAFIQE